MGLDLRPFGHEVGQGLRLDGTAGGLLDVVAHELEPPFVDPSCSVVAVDDLLEQE
jgi:hypothetical protein